MSWEVTCHDDFLKALLLHTPACQEVFLIQSEKKSYKMYPSNALEKAALFLFASNVHFV